MKHSLLDKIRIYLLHVRLIAKSNFMYKFNSLTIGFAVIVREAINIAVIYLLFAKFSNIKAWNIDELLFLYSFLFLSYSLVTFLFAGIRDFESVVYEGEFDRYLLRPLGPLFQVISSKADYAATFGHGIIGMALFCVSANAVGIEWNARNILFLAASIAGGVMIQTSLFLIASTFSFWTVKTMSIRNILFFSTRRFAGYPISIYPVLIRVTIIYLIPFAFVNYFPVQYFLNKPDVVDYPGFFYFLAPLVGVFMLFVSNIFWRVGVKNYTSVGN